MQSFAGGNRRHLLTSCPVTQRLELKVAGSNPTPSCVRKGMFFETIVFTQNYNILKMQCDKRCNKTLTATFFSACVDISGPAQID